MGRSDVGVVCGLCWSRIPSLPSPKCDRCGHPLQGSVCRWCELLPPYVRAVRSVCWMPIEPASSIVHALKYEGWSVIAGDLAQRMSRLAWPADVVDERGALVPVQQPGAPMLFIQNLQNGTARIYWVPGTPGFVVQESGTLSITNTAWVNSQASYTNGATVPASPQNRFFRLIKP